MTTICSIVDRAYENFGAEIDPDQRYTPAGLQAVGMTLEDLEEYLGFARGWTSISEEVPNKELRRLSALTRNIPRSEVKPLLKRYLKRELNYPSVRFRYPD